MEISTNKLITSIDNGFYKPIILIKISNTHILDVL
jgi:hypothetical protein